MADPAPLRTRLPRLDLVEAQNRAALLGLSGTAFDDAGLTLTLQTAGAGSGGGSWIRFDTGSGFAFLSPDRIAGAAVAWPEGAVDAAEAVAALSRLEPLIVALEQTSGLALEPVGLGAATGAAVRLEALSGEGAAVHAVRFALDACAAERWRASAPSRVALERLGPVAGMPSPCALRLDGPVARRSELAELGVGDFVVAPRTLGGVWPARFGPVDGPLRLGVFDPLASRFIAALQETPSMLDADPRPATAADPLATGGDAPRSLPADLPVRLQVAVRELKLPLREVAALRPGSVIALPALGEDLVVDLLADGERIATGRLVALGDAYGVLIDDVAAR